MMGPGTKIMAFSCGEAKPQGKHTFNTGSILWPIQFFQISFSISWMLWAQRPLDTHFPHECLLGLKIKPVRYDLAPRTESVRDKWDASLHQITKRSSLYLTPRRNLVLNLCIRTLVQHQDMKNRCKHWRQKWRSCAGKTRSCVLKVVLDIQLRR